MNRTVKMLCGFGLIVVIVASVGGWILEHRPLPGGLESIPSTGMSFEEKEEWMVRLLLGCVGIGLAGVILLVLGGIKHIVLKFGKLSA